MIDNPRPADELEDRRVAALADLVATGETVIETADLRTYVRWVDGTFQVTIEPRDD